MTAAVIVEADGACRGNPGLASYGALLRDPRTQEVLDSVAEAIGVTTNNVAEYRGLIAGLEMVRARGIEGPVEVRMDSKLVVEQMSGRWKIKHRDMQRLALVARDLLPKQVSFVWVPRSDNSDADRLANAALDDLL